MSDNEPFRLRLRAPSGIEREKVVHELMTFAWDFEEALELRAFLRQYAIRHGFTPAEDK